MTAPDFLKKLPGALNTEAAAGQQFVAQLNISTPTVVTLADGICTVQEGTTDTADVTLTLSDENLIKLLTGEMSGATAFMMGKLQIDGDLMLAKDIPGFFDSAKLA